MKNLKNFKCNNLEQIMYKKIGKDRRATKLKVLNIIMKTSKKYKISYNRKSDSLAIKQLSRGLV
jgi:hypothetical protein